MAVVTGTSGNDVLVGTNNNDTIKGLNGDDQLQGLDGDDIIDGGSGNDTIDAGTGNNVLLGGMGNDILSGGDDGNRLDGGAGVDSMTSGTGDDTYVVDNTLDLITDGGGTDIIQSSVSFTLGSGIENLTLTGFGGVMGIGNALNNNITGNQAANKLFGFGGDDVLDGGLGADTLTGGLGDDFYGIDNAKDKIVELAGEGYDTIITSVSYTMGDNVDEMQLFAGVNGPYVLKGNAIGNLIISKSDENNTLDGAGGDDLVVGGAGNDTYIVDSFNDTVFDNGGTDVVKSSVTYSLSFGTTGVENLTLTGTANIDGTGNGSGNVITGNAGVNVLDGSGGTDTLDGGKGLDFLIGGTGDDVFIIGDSGDTIVELGGGGTADEARINVSFDLSAQGANVEILTLLGAGSINGTGNASANTITGNKGANILSGNDGNDTISGGAGNDKLFGGNNDDTLDGGAGSDTLAGNDGNDVYIVNATTGITIIEQAGEGQDEVQSTVTHTLAAEVEILTLLGTGNLNGFGNASDNTITGTTGNNTLDGKAGADSLVGGGGGIDVFIVDNAGDVVDATGGSGTIFSSVSWDLGVNTTNITNLVLTGVNPINGTGDGNDNTITGSTAFNQLFGLGGDDVLVCDAFDLLDGGLGNDTAVIGASAIINNPGWTSIENITLTGTGTFFATGDGGNNTLIGNSAINTLDGGLGNDSYGITSGDVIIDAGGIDTVLAGFTYTLIAGMENLTLTGAGNINGFGDGGNNIITGNSGNNTLDGFAGNDVLIGGLGNDTYIVDHAGITITENPGEGGDTVRASITYALAVGDNLDALVLTGTGNINGTGNDGDNILTGNSGNNILDGGTGTDTMAGGMGNDTFLVDHDGEVTSDTGGFDVVIATDASHTIGKGIENLTLVSVLNMNINGTGNTGANLITGTDGNNSLDGGHGTDTLIGGLGDDTYFVDLSTDQVFENIGEGTDTINAHCTYVMPHDVEILNITDTLSWGATGNSIDNTITGNTGNNNIRGGDGDDTLFGGEGADVLHGDIGNDVLQGDGGIDHYYGGDGADFFVFTDATAFDGSLDVIIDYSAIQSDAIDISDILAATSYVPGVSNLDDYVTVLNNHFIAVDVSGHAGANNGWVTIAQLMNVVPNELVFVKDT